MTKKHDSNGTRRIATAEGEALDALNMQTLRKGSARRQIEQNIEAKARRRRSDEAPASSTTSKRGP